jgi:hypothetical protein
MSLKQLVKKERLLHPAVDAELVLPGEPMIYSIKYPLANRSRSTQFFRNMQWKSLLKSFFKSYYRTSIPVVVVVRFYVSPPDSVNIAYKDLAKEETPAVFAYEACDYLLSFLEMLHHVLINSYRQVVKIEVDKFYSTNPRTVFKFMKWDQYVQLQSKNTVYPKAESVSEDRQIRELQPIQSGNASDKRVCEKILGDGRNGWTIDDRTASSDSALQNTSSVKPAWKKTRSAKLPT